MGARLLYVDEAANLGSIDDLSDVWLMADIDVGPEGFLPRGTRGTIMAVHGGGEAYDVEFAEPFHALLLLRADELEVIPGATRERLIAATGDVRD